MNFIGGTIGGIHDPVKRTIAFNAVYGATNIVGRGITWACVEHHTSGVFVIDPNTGILTYPEGAPTDQYMTVSARMKGMSNGGIAIAFTLADLG